MSAATPAVTVAVCTRNRPVPLEHCLSSLARLDPPPDEILVVDQSDVQNAVKVGALCVEPIRYVASEPRGLGFARQVALEHARSPVLAFTDDDCIVWPGWIGAIRRAFRDHPDAGAVTGAVRPRSPEPLDGDVPGWVTHWGGHEERVFREPADPAEIGGGLNMAIRAEELRQIGGFDPMFGPGAEHGAADDTDILYRLLMGGFSIVYTPDAVVSHLPPRDRRAQDRQEHLYAGAYGAWAAKAWGQGDRLPARFWWGSFRRTVSNLVRRAPFDRPDLTRKRAEVAWHLVAGWARGARARRAPRKDTR